MITKAALITSALLALPLTVASQAAKIETIPAPLLHTLNKLNLISQPILVNGDLHVALKFDEIEELQAKSTVEDMCFAYYGDAKGKTNWTAGSIQRVFIENSDHTQGYVYQDGDKSCDLLGEKSGNDSAAFITERLAKANFKPATLN
ncbi:hypothetical protein VRB80_21010 [Erwinia aphidicola]|uniref:hypothetical protein n=1 Tax=Erwinia aphidicola TaxID=68334 RepID=UPI0030CAE280